MKLFVFLAFSFILFNFSTICPSSAWVQLKSVEDYYWRDFNGLIPTDAIVAGTDQNGNDTFIGQFTTIAEYNVEHVKLHTIPGVIKVGSQVVVAPYNGRIISSNQTTNTKVMCYSSSHYNYKWIPATSPFQPKCRFVIGGNEDGIPLYIGRAFHNKELIIGKVFSDTTLHRSDLICGYDGTEVYHKEFEMLSHCP